jgi:hypothetical protein
VLVGAIVGGGVFAILIGLWFAYPQWDAAKSAARREALRPGAAKSEPSTMPVDPARAPLADAPAEHGTGAPDRRHDQHLGLCRCRQAGAARGSDCASHRRVEAALHACRHAGDLRQRQPRALALGVPRDRAPGRRSERHRRGRSRAA